MPEAQLTARLDRAAEKGGFKEKRFAALKAAVEADVGRVPQTGECECDGNSI